MKLKSILMSGIIGLAIGSMANAAAPAVTLHITGSTAYRNATHAAILHVFDSMPMAVKSTNKTYTAFRGMISGTDTLVTCYWSGSEQAVLALAQQTTANKLTFLSYSAVDNSGNIPTKTDLSDVNTVAGSDSNPTSLGTPLATYVNDNTYADAGMADTFQASSLYKTNATKGYNSLKGGNNYSDGIVGVVMFKWLASKGTTAITNVTSQQIKALYVNGGYMDMSQFTGNSSDMSTNYVYGIGRDSFSGTRLTAFAETGVGATATVTQYEPQDGTGTQITGTGATVAQLGNSTGYTSGGTLCKAIANVAPGSVSGSTIMIGYAGTGDSDVSGQGIAAGAVELGYNGVVLGTGTNNWTKVANGQYSFWGYEHLYYTPAIGSSASTDSDKTLYLKKTVADLVAKQIRDGGVGVQKAGADAMLPLISAMNCTRATDGGSVTSTATDNSPF